MRRISFWPGLIVVFGAACAACADDGSSSAGPGGAGGTTSSTGGGGAGGTGGAGGAGGSACVPRTEACDGVDQDCDGVPDDGPCSTPALSSEFFIGGSGVDHIRGVGFDSSGNVYITGAVTFPANIGGGEVAGAKAYVASFTPDGAFRWQYLWGDASGYDYGQDLAVSDDLVCVAGAFAGTFDFGGGARTAGGYNDALLLCLHSIDGGYVFDRAFGADLADSANGVAITPGGDVVVTGAFENSADFGGGTVQGLQYNDLFVARYSPDGAYQWARTFPGDGTEHGEAVVVDASENSYIAGTFTSVIDFGGGPRVPGAALYVPLLLKLDQAGDYVWDFSGTTCDYTVFYGMGLTSTGDVVVGGEFTGAMALGGDVVTSVSEFSSDVFAARFDPSGQLVWQYTAGDAGSDRGFDLAVGPGDDVVLVGGFTDTMAFGDEPRTSAGSYDVFAVGLTPSGAYRWDVVVGGADEEEAEAVAVDATGRIAVGGGTWGDLDLGQGLHTNAGSLDGVLFYLE